MPFGFLIAQPSSPISPQLPQWANATHAWGDYDSDGDPDLYLSGLDSLGFLRGEIFKLSGTILTMDPQQHVVAVRNGSAAWADFDNDGDLDLAVMGDTMHNHPCVVVYRNDLGSLVRLPSSPMGASAGDLCWADLDNDNDLELVVGGWNGGEGPVGYILRNDGSSIFEEMPFPPFSTVQSISIAVGDIDGDGRLDIAMSGKPSTGLERLLIYRNLGAFHWDSVGHALNGNWQGNLDFGQFGGGPGNTLLVNGFQPEAGARLLRFQNAALQILPCSIQGLGAGEARWLDYDNDGDLDVAVSGYFGGISQTRIYRNTNGVFSLLQPISSLPGLMDAKLEAVDWNLDQKSDLCLSGYDINGLSRTVLLTYDSNLQQFRL
jgi:hypothetical protein